MESRAGNSRDGQDEASKQLKGLATELETSGCDVMGWELHRVFWGAGSALEGCENASATAAWCLDRAGRVAGQIANHDEQTAVV
jgi:hypothetical protein